MCLMVMLSNTVRLALASFLSFVQTEVWSSELVPDPSFIFASDGFGDSVFADPVIIELDAGMQEEGAPEAALVIVTDTHGWV